MIPNHRVFEVFAEERCSDVNMDHLVRSYCAGSEGEAEVAEGQRKQKDGSSGGGCTVIVKCDASKGEEESQSLPAKT